jgi:hypothetical protein
VHTFTHHLLLGLALLAPIVPIRAEVDEAAPVTNLQNPERFKPAEFGVELRDRNLELQDTQIGVWEDPVADLDLAALGDVVPPCRSIRSDGRALTVAMVCADAAGDERLLVVYQGVILRFPRPLVRGSSIGLSDDGVRVAAVMQEEGGAVLHLLDLHRTRDIIVLGLDQPDDPALAGAGTAVACTAQVGGERHVVLVDLDDSLARVLSAGHTQVVTGAIAANGRRTVYRGQIEGQEDYYLVDVDRKVRFNISDSDGTTTAVDVSQHGDVVAFVSRFGGAMGVFTADINNRKVLNRSGAFQPLGEVFLSATGSRFAVVRTGVAEALEVWDTDGRHTEQVSTIVDEFDALDMSSDGLFVTALCPYQGRRAAAVRIYPLPARE